MFKNVHFLNYKLLSLELSQGSVDDELAVKYLIWQSIIFGGVIKLPVEIVDQKIYSSFIEFLSPILFLIVLALINIYGIRYLYKANKMGDGEDFFKRLICLSLPVGLFITLLTIVPIMIVFFYASSLSYQVSNIAGLFMLAVILIWSYWLLYKCFAFIGTATVRR